MPEGDLNPAQEKFFSRYINKGLFAKARGKKDAEFAAAFAGYKIADATAIAALSGLPNYGTGSAEADEKSELFARYQAVQDETLKKQGNNTTAIAACVQAKSDLDVITGQAKALMDKALTDDTLDGPHRIQLLKQTAYLHLAEVIEEFDAKAAPLLAQIAENSDGMKISLPMGVELRDGVKTLREDVVAVPSTLEVAAAKEALDSITKQADQLLATKLAAVTSFAGSDTLVIVLANAKLDGQIQSGLSIAKANAEQMGTWDVPDAQSFASETEKLNSRALVLFGKTTATAKTEADDASAQRNALLDEISALNARSNKAIQDKKFAFGQLFRDVEARFGVVERAFRDIDDTSFAKGQAGPIIDFLGLTRTAINDLNGYNTAALVAAKKLVDQAALIVTNAQKASAINERLTDQLVEIGRVIAYGTGKQNALSAKFIDYKQEHDDLSRNWQTMLLSDATTAVRGFVTRVAADVQLTKAIDLRRVAARAELALTQKDLELFNTAYGKMLAAHGRKVKPYEGDITRDLANVEVWIETKFTLSFYDGIDATLTRLRTEIGGLFGGLQATDGKSDDDLNTEAVALQKELMALSQQTTLVMTDRGEEVDPLALKSARAAVAAQIAKLSTRSDLLGHDNDLERQRTEDAEAKEAYLLEARDWVKSTDDAVKAAQPGDPMNQYRDDVKAQMDRVSGTIKTVIKGAPVQFAASELAFVKKTVLSIIARGPRTTKNELGRMAADWATAVDGFADNCTEFLDLVQIFADNQEVSAAHKSLKSSLTAVVNRLDRTAFDGVAADLTVARNIASAREKALQKVRYFNDLLLKDPVIQQCVLNPFGYRDFASPIARRLRQIELNVLRAA